MRSKDDSDRKDAPTPKRASGRREQAWTEGLAPPPGPGNVRFAAVARESGLRFFFVAANFCQPSNVNGLNGQIMLVPRGSRVQRPTPSVG